VCHGYWIIQRAQPDIIDRRVHAIAALLQGGKGLIIDDQIAFQQISAHINTAVERWHVLHLGDGNVLYIIRGFIVLVNKEGFPNMERKPVPRVGIHDGRDHIVTDCRAPADNELRQERGERLRRILRGPDCGLIPRGKSADGTPIVFTSIYPDVAEVTPAMLR
jgi:hypothetical protein